MIIASETSPIWSGWRNRVIASVPSTPIARPPMLDITVYRAPRAARLASEAGAARAAPPSSDMGMITGLGTAGLEDMGTIRRVTCKPRHTAGDPRQARVRSRRAVSHALACHGCGAAAHGPQRPQAMAACRAVEQTVHTRDTT